jgi:uncharacterized repeat protein (TIGR01451 family)
MVFVGSISNSGNIALTGVTVTQYPTNDSQPPVLLLGPIALAPGESQPYAGTFFVPVNTCFNISDTVIAIGTNVCTGSNVTTSAFTVCPVIPTPRLTITKHCPPNPVAPGQLLMYTGSISNSGSITITNIFVVNDRPVPLTPVFGPITLTPGQSQNFSGSYTNPYDCCGPCVDTLTARGQDICAGSNVVATASAACPRTNTPAIFVTRSCPTPPPTLGDLAFFSGVVSNSGDATLASVSVVDDQAGVIMNNQALAPGEAQQFQAFYIVTNCGPSVADGVSASGSDICTGLAVSNRFVAACQVLCSTSPPVQVVLSNPTTDGTNFHFTFPTVPGQSYTVQFSDLLSPANWQTLSHVTGDGSSATVSDAMTNTQRFYRVLSD